MADIIAFFKGYADGTQTCLNNAPESIARALVKATTKRSELQRKHASKMKGVQDGTGWLVQVIKVIDIPAAK